MLTKKRVNHLAWTYLAIFLASFMSCTLASATPTVKQGLDAINNNQYHKAYRILKPLAENGNLEAQERLALLHFSDPGDNPHFDKDKGYYWQRKSAEAGYYYAQFTLGYQLSSDASEHDREIRYKMKKESYQWYLKAANQGFPFAQIEVGHFLSQGKYVERDRVKAYMWYSLAMNRTKSNQKDSASTEGLAGSFRKNLMRYMTPKEIEKGEIMTKDWEKANPNTILP